MASQHLKMKHQSLFLRPEHEEKKEIMTGISLKITVLWDITM
jgi:hypothetical protein